MKQKKGFSIIEVLVALAIMGIVAGISVPNYTKMQRSSKKAEAQSSLGQVYIAEKAFFLQWRYYTVDLVRIGAIPEGPLTYNVGFSGEGKGTSNNGIKCTGTSDKPNCGPDDYNGGWVNKENNNFFKICGQEFGKNVGQCAFSYKKGGEDKGFEPPSIKKMLNNKQYDAGKDNFTAGAIANLIKKDSNDCQGKECDMWSIDQFKRVRRECGANCPY